jgi:hypothetical protein
MHDVPDLAVSNWVLLEAIVPGLKTPMVAFMAAALSFFGVPTFLVGAFRQRYILSGLGFVAFGVGFFLAVIIAVGRSTGVWPV